MFDETSTFVYGYRFAKDEFGGQTDYVIEGKIPWDALMHYDLPTRPTIGTEMGFVWILPDPDGGYGFGGQLQCWGWADEIDSYSTWRFTNLKAGS